MIPLCHAKRITAYGTLDLDEVEGVRRTSTGSRAGLILLSPFTNATDMALKSYRPPDAPTPVSWQFAGDLCLPRKEKRVRGFQMAETSLFNNKKER